MFSTGQIRPNSNYIRKERTFTGTNSAINNYILRGLTRRGIQLGGVDLSKIGIYRGKGVDREEYLKRYIKRRQKAIDNFNSNDSRTFGYNEVNAIRNNANLDPRAVSAHIGLDVALNNNGMFTWYDGTDGKVKTTFKELKRALYKNGDDRAYSTKLGVVQSWNQFVRAVRRDYRFESKYGNNIEAGLAEEKKRSVVNRIKAGIRKGGEIAAVGIDNYRLAQEQAAVKQIEGVNKIINKRARRTEALYNAYTTNTFVDPAERIRVNDVIEAVNTRRDNAFLNDTFRNRFANKYNINQAIVDNLLSGNINPLTRAGIDLGVKLEAAIDEETESNATNTTSFTMPDPGIRGLRRALNNGF